MDNAVKALYMAGGTLIGILILSSMVYIFRNGATMGENYYKDRDAEHLQAYNNQFDRYVGVADQSKNTADGYSFRTKSNTVSDVITCANLAYSINKRNKFDLAENVTVQVNIKSDKYYIYPFESQPNNYFFKNVNESTARSSPTNPTKTDLNSSKYMRLYDFIQKFGTVKIVNISSPDYSSLAESIYQYYFDVKAEGLEYDFERTGKIRKITFEAYETAHFNDSPYWVEI